MRSLKSGRVRFSQRGSKIFSVHRKSISFLQLSKIILKFEKNQFEKNKINRRIYLLSLLGRVFFSLVSVFFNFVLSKLLTSEISGLSLILKKEESEKDLKENTKI